MPSPPRKKQHRSKREKQKAPYMEEVQDEEEEEEVAMSLDQGLGLSLEPTTPPAKRGRESPDLDQEFSASKKLKMLREESPVPALRRSPRKRAQA